MDRMPFIVHRKTGADIADIADAALAEIAVGDTLVIYPHEICPADGEVSEGHGVMDESYLTGELLQSTKTTGSLVIFGAINGETALTMPLFFAGNANYFTEIMPGWLKTASPLNPLSYVVDALSTAMLAGSTSIFGLWINYAVVLVTTITLVMIGARLYPRLTI